MQHLTESAAAAAKAAAAAAATAAAAKTPPRATADAAAAFQNELRARMAAGSASATTDTASAAPTSPAAVMERLAAAFPGATITSANLGSFGAVRDHYAASSAVTSVNLDAATIERMGTDNAFAQQVESALTGLLAAGSERQLVAAGGSATSRHASVSGGVVRYTEVQRTASGTQMSVTSLSITGNGGGGGGGGQGANGADLDAILADLAASGGTGSGGGPFDFLFRPADQNAAFAGQTTAGGNWRLESFLTAGSMWTVTSGAARTVTTTQERLKQGQLQQWQFQERQITMKETVRQWAATGARVDLQSYMELMGLNDPLVLDLAGDGINLKSAEDGVYFDIHADGRPVRTAFIQGDDAFLYLDENGNGAADSAAELFGDHGGFAGGFDKLARHDANADGVIDVHDAVYDKLRLWQDKNGDGVNQEDESLSLADAGVAAINLRHGGGRRLDQSGNVIADVGSFLRADGRSGRIADAWLRSLG